MRKVVEIIDFKTRLKNEGDMRIAYNTLTHHLLKGGTDADLTLIETKTGKAYLYKEIANGAGRIETK